MNDDSIKSQLSFNHSIKESFEESDIIERIANLQKQLSKDYQEDLDSSFYENRQSYPLIMWSDENVIVYIKKNEINLGDRIEQEIEIISSTYLEKTLINFHLFTLSNRSPRYEQVVMNFIMNSSFIFIAN